MFLVHIPAERAGFDHWLFFARDPRPSGCTRPVVEPVELEAHPSGDQTAGEPLSASRPILARSTDEPTRFKLFAIDEMIPRSFDVLEGFAFAFADWESFLESPVAKDGACRPFG